MTSRDERPDHVDLRGLAGCALTVDLEEWYHTCWVPEYVRPTARPPLANELDRSIPELLEMLDRHRARATFFVLGEVAQRLPRRIREIAEGGHEVASHGFHHLRVGELDLPAFRLDVMRSRALLEEIVGRPVLGYRAPEWSMRTPANPRLRVLAELGFRYDSSLVPYPGAGDRGNPTVPVRFCWSDGAHLDELPPLTLGGLWQLPASGWTARLLPPRIVARAAARAREAGRLAVAVVHPWELTGRATPGELTGIARIVHEAGRFGYRETFEGLLALERWGSVADALAASEVVAADAGVGEAIGLGAASMVEAAPR